MARLACVKLPLLGLQIVLRANPEWRNFPAVLLDRLDPRGVVLQANKYARRARITPGMRYASGLSRCHDLRATTLDAPQLKQARQEIETRLRAFSPSFDSPAELSNLPFLKKGIAQKSSSKVAKSNRLIFETPDVFWLQATGLDTLYGTFDAWADAIGTALKEAEFYAAIAVGFSRFGTYALAHALGVGTLVLESPEQEKRQFRAQPLSRLELDALLIESLIQLGVDTVGAFLDLPASAIESRFGKEMRLFYEFASNKYLIPIKSSEGDAPIEQIITWEGGRPNAERLLFQIKFALHEMALKLASRGLVFGRLEMTFYLKSGAEIAEQIRPARPSLDEAALIELVRLRLDALDLPASPTRLHLRAVGFLSEADQTRLLSAGHDRRWGEAQHALARLRAEFGPQSVLGFRARDVHLPEGRFALQPLQTLPRPFSEGATSTPGAPALLGATGQRGESEKPAPTRDEPPSLVRRVLTQPEPLGLIAPSSFEDPLSAQSPYLVCGGWWSSNEVHREYYYADTERGELLWVFYDHIRRGWFVHGRVE